MVPLLLLRSVDSRPSEMTAWEGGRPQSLCPESVSLILLVGFPPSLVQRQGYRVGFVQYNGDFPYRRANQ